MKFFIEYFLFKFFSSIILLIPLKFVQKLGKWLGGIAFYIITSRRKSAIENLKHAFPEKSDTEIKFIAKKVFQNLGISFCEFLWFPKFTPEIIAKLIRYSNFEKMINAYQKHKKLIMLSGHFGNWELIAMATGVLTQLPLTIIVKTQKNIFVDRIVNIHRTLYGNKIVDMKLAVREILSTLNNGGIVAMVADQSAPKECVFVPFFGREVATYEGPAVFALRSGAPIQMGIIIRNSDFTYDIHLEEIDISDISEYNKANVRELTRRHTELLEKYIRSYPDLWMWTHRRWKNVK